MAFVFRRPGIYLTYSTSSAYIRPVWIFWIQLIQITHSIREISISYSAGIVLDCQIVRNSRYDTKLSIATSVSNPWHTTRPVCWMWERTLTACLMFDSRILFNSSSVGKKRVYSQSLYNVWPVGGSWKK